MAKKDFVSLMRERPDVAKYWDFEENGDLRLEDVSKGSGRYVAWKCEVANVITGEPMTIRWIDSVYNQVYRMDHSKQPQPLLMCV